jgi:hypothetical protein
MSGNDFQTLRDHFESSRVAAASVEQIFSNFELARKEVKSLQESLEELHSLRSTDAESAQSALSAASAENAAAMEREVERRHRAADCIELVKQEVEEEMWRIASRLRDHEK